MPVAPLPVLYVPPEEGASKAAGVQRYTAGPLRPDSSEDRVSVREDLPVRRRTAAYVPTEDPYRSYTYPVGRSRPTSAFLSLGACSQDAALRTHST